MKHFTKCMLTAALLIAGLGVVNAQNHMLKVTNGESAKPNPWDYQANYEFPTALTSGKTYVFECAINAVNGGETRIVPSDGTTSDWLDTKGLWTNKFTKYSVEFTAKANFTKVEIDLGACAGEVYFDNVSLVEKGETTNLIANGDFETDDLTGWSVSTWAGSTMARVEKEAPGEVLDPGMFISVGDAGWRTFSTGSSIKIDDPNVTAYVAKYIEEGNYIKLKEVTEIPGWQPVLIEAAKGNYMVQIIASAEGFPWGDNGLIKNGGSALKGDGTLYALAKKNGVVGFYKMSTESEIPAWAIYMKIESSSAREYIGFGNDATTIKAVEALEASGMIYNLGGQRVKNAQKGLFIINGKKVIK